MATMIPKYNYIDIKGDLNLPIQLPCGLLSKYESNVHIVNDPCNYYNTSLTYEMNISCLPIKTDVSFKR